MINSVLIIIFFRIGRVILTVVKFIIDLIFVRGELGI